MRETTPSSGWAGKLSPNAARLVLAALIVVVLVLVWIALEIAEPARRAGPGDFDTYARVVAALRAGHGYYPALHQALLDGGYGTISPLNWRTPVFLTILSWFPSLEAARWTLAALTAFAWALTVGFVYRRAGLATAIWGGVVLALSLVAIGAPRAELSFELCAGTLILMSVSAYGLGWRWIGFAVAVVALFVRELAGIYVLVCLVCAVRDRHWREVGAWAVALAAYGCFYLWHWMQIAPLLGPGDHAAASSWLQLGGLAFVLRTAEYNGVLLVLPYWVAAIVLVVGLVGLVRVPRPGMTVVIYLLLFLVYGRPENEYWGAMYAPLVALGVAFAPAVAARVALRAWGRPLHQASLGSPSPALTPRRGSD
jgi:hypothetical protein